MSRLKVHFILIPLLLIEQLLFTCGQTKPSFRIIAPQNICGIDGNDTYGNFPDGIVISFQPKDAIKFSYKFRIFFKNVIPETFSQRETLLIWKAVRHLEHRINTVDRLKISRENKLFLNKSEVVPGVNYIFHVVGITNSGETSNELVFNVKYAESISVQNTVPDGINIMLVGSGVAVASSSFTYFAKVSACTQVLDYYVHWMIQGLREENQELQRLISSTLTVPPNSFTAGTNVKIEAHVLETISSKVLAKDSIEVSVVSRGFEAYIIPSSAKIGVHCTLKFKLFIRDFDNEIENVEVLWDYFEMSNEPISHKINFENNKNFIISFQKAGRYKVVASAKLNDVSTKMIADVEVVPNMLLSYDFGYEPELNPAPNQLYEFTVLISGLKPNCVAGWICAQEDGYKFISPVEIGKSNFGEYKVPNLEIVDLADSIINKEVILSIPPGDHHKGRWNGLEGDARYKFRLDVLCPAEYSNTNFTMYSQTSSHFEYVIHTNSPPFAEKLNIRPVRGTALKTVFQISITDAKDLLLDNPLSYELCGVFENFTTCFGKYFEYKSWETSLPYTETSIVLFVKVCDIRNACSTVYNKDVIVEHLELTDKDFKYLKLNILSAFLRTDYVEGHNAILMASITYKNTNIHLFEEMRTFVRGLLNKEINKIVELPTHKMYISPEQITKFVSLSRINLEILEINETSILLKLLELMENVSVTFDEKYVHTGFLNSDLDTQNRYKTQVETHLQYKAFIFVDALYIETILILIESTIKSKPHLTIEEGVAIMKHINSLTEKMCYNDAITNEILEKPFVSIKLEKHAGSFLLKKVNTIPNGYTKEEGLFKLTAFTKSVIVNSKEYCTVVIQYPKDYFTDEEMPLVNIRIFDISTSSNIMELKMNENESERIQYPIYLEISKKYNFENMCLLRTENKWTKQQCKVLQVKALHVSCSCSQLGYFRLAEMSKFSEKAVNGQNVSPLPPDYNNPGVTVPGNIATLTTPTTIATTIMTTDTTSGAKQTIQIKDVLIQTGGNIVNSTGQSDKRKSPQKASTFKYLFPMILVSIIATVFIFGVLYRRHKKKSNDSLICCLNMPLQMRQRRQGIKYATIFDHHLMHGSI